MIKTLTITRLNKFTNDKDGKPLIGKTGKPYTRILLKAKEYGDNTISGFGQKESDAWKAGDEVRLDVVEVTKGEKTYYNFNYVDQDAENMDAISKLQKGMEALLNRVKRLEASGNQGRSDGQPPVSFEATPSKSEDDINPEDIPF
jgi:uncharacterized coiled-coil protein SlyX